MISEIFVAESDDEAAGYIDEGPSASGLAYVIRADELTALEFDALQSTLTGESFRDVLESRKGGLVLGRGETGPWITRLRPTLTDALASMDDAGVPDVASRWAAHDEVEDLDSATLAEVLPPLARLARVAEDRDGRLYLWNRL